MRKKDNDDDDDRLIYNLLFVLDYKEICSHLNINLVKNNNILLKIKPKINIIFTI